MTPVLGSFEVLDSGKCLIGESPVCRDETRLVWVDAETARVFLADRVTGQIRETRLEVPVTAIAPAARGEWVLVTKQGLYQSDPDFGHLRFLGNPVQRRPELRLNDGVVSPNGDLWFGSMNGQDLERPDGGVFLLTKEDLDITLLDSGFSVTNGIAFDRERQRAYVTNMFRRVILEYSLDDSFRRILAKKVFAVIPEQQGMPDGLKTDRDGNLYVCHWNAGLLSVYNPVGARLKEVQLPVRHATRCTFGGPGWSRLYITSGCYEMNETEQRQSPWSGLTLHCDASIPGAPEAVFGV